MVFQNLIRNRPATIQFQLDGTHVSYVNTLRRAIITEVPTVGFRADMNDKGATTDVVIVKNSTPMTNEMLAHRIGLIPIHADAKTWSPEKFTFKMSVKNESSEKMNINTDLITVLNEEGIQVPSSQFFHPDPITKQFILLAVLRGVTTKEDIPEEIEWTATATVGRGRENARFIAASQASYEYTRDPDPEKRKEYFDKWLLAHKKIVPESLVSDETKRKALNAEFDTMEVARCYIQDERGEPIRFDFTVESIGVMKPESIVLRAIDEIIVKCHKYETIPADVVVQPADSKILGFDFVFRNEDHSLGNLLQTWIVENIIDDNINYCGYYVPHPLQDEMILRIGVADGNEVTARNAMMKAARACALMFESWKAEWGGLIGTAPAAAVPVKKRLVMPGKKKATVVT
jgi:DNA-directed RNA polymerase subunit L